LKALAAAPVSTSRLAADAKERALLCARIAEDNKARDIRVLDLRGITPLYDYFVIATGVGRRQIHAIVEEVDAAMRAEGDIRLHIEGYESGKWIVQDYGDVVVHVFDSASREYYGLDDLWADAPRLDWEHSY
jgi:ribosome-associated protein